MNFLNLKKHTAQELEALKDALRTKFTDSSFDPEGLGITADFTVAAEKSYPAPKHYPTRGEHPRLLFKKDMIPKEVLERIIEAGTYAPTGRNFQSPVILAITNKEVRDRLSRVNASVMGMDGDPFYGAPVVLVVLADKSVITHIYDGSLVMGNLMLAAHSEGVGSCWIHRAKEEFELPEWKDLLKSLGVEGEYEGIGHCILGYPEGEIPPVKPRKSNYVFWVE